MTKGGRTETIRQRTLWVYVPTEVRRVRGEKLADGAGFSVSRRILAVEEMRPLAGSTLGPRDRALLLVSRTTRCGVDSTCVLVCQG